LRKNEHKFASAANLYRRLRTLSLKNAFISPANQGAVYVAMFTLKILAESEWRHKSDHSQDESSRSLSEIFIIPNQNLHFERRKG
jgi:hypothetical protein